MSTQQSGLVSGNKQNVAGGATAKFRSKFPLSYSQFQTERFAEYVPFHVMEGVSGDTLPLHCNHEVQTYTLKSPILQSLSKKKDYFAVPMQAILPLNWEKFYTNPNIGEDVPYDCGCGVENFWNKMGTLFNTSYSYLNTYLQSSSNTGENKLDRLFHFLFFFEQIYSTGSLMETLGISGHNYALIYNTRTVKRITFDEYFDDMVSMVATALAGNGKFGLQIGSEEFNVVGDAYYDPNANKDSITLRVALELMRDDLTFTINGITGTNMTTAVSNIAGAQQDYTISADVSEVPLNIARLWAYQICCAHFFTNDHVDFIYSADLFRQYIYQLVTGDTSSGVQAYVNQFTVNGFNYAYDSLSAKFLNILLSRFSSTSGIFGYSTTTGSNTRLEALAYFTALFGFKRSLRFMDYFTGSRSLPLAVGDHEATVGTNTAGKLDIIELSRASMMTKFLQAVNRSGRKFSNYMKELFGKVPAYDYHNPMFLAHNSDLVGAPETENTGAGQLDTNRDIAVTSRFRATASRYAYEFTPDRDCIVIGISYYDIPRVYTKATERQNFVLDRFDMFNPYLQFTGDQPIYEAEIGTNTPDLTPFSYTNKDMQYKQRFNQASGAFCVESTGLDNWIFVADVLHRSNFHHISSSFIRSFNSEIDRFYQRLTGYSLGTYFHFIVRYDNRMDASRPMAYNPTINV